MADTYKLAQELRDTLHHPDFRVHEQVIENARKELEAPVFLNEKEKELFTGETDRFGIYQLKDGEELHYHRFASLDLTGKVRSAGGKGKLRADLYSAASKRTDPG